MKKLRSATLIMAMTAMSIMTAMSLSGCLPNKVPETTAAAPDNGGGTENDNGTGTSETGGSSSDKGQSEAAASAGNELVIKVGASSGPTQPAGMAGQKIADLVNERLKGQVRIDYYPGEQLGNETAMLENMQVNLQQGMFNSFDTYANIAKDLNIMSMAFAFESKEHLYKYLESDLAKPAFDTLEQNGIHVVAYQFQKNPRAIFGKKPITKAADLKGVKFRIPNIPIWEKNFSTLGAAPTITSWAEYPLAMMQGVVDAGECSYESINALKLHQSAPYISLVDYAYPLECFTLNMQTWNKLTDEQKKVIEECAAEVEVWFSDYVKSQWEEDKKVIESEGGQFVEFDKQSFIDAMAPLAPELEAEGYWETKDLYNQVQALK